MCGPYSTNSEFKFETLILMSSLGDYSGACMLVEGSITVPKTVVQDVATSFFNKIIFKEQKYSKIALNLLIP